jgi:hypothetical protein
MCVNCIINVYNYVKVYIDAVNIVSYFKMNYIKIVLNLIIYVYTSMSIRLMLLPNVLKTLCSILSNNVKFLFQYNVNKETINGIKL